MPSIVLLLSKAGCQNNSKVASHILLTFCLFSSKSDSMNENKSGAESYKCLDRRDCEQIRVFSRRSWEKHEQQRERSATTYAAEHPHKTMDEPTAVRARPSSPTRRHRPHPTRSLYVIKEPPHKTHATGECYQENSYIHQALCSRALPECVPAVNHWLRRATQQDVQLLERMLKNL